MIESTPFKVGISKENLELIILQQIADNISGAAHMTDIYNRINAEMNKSGFTLSKIAKNCVRVTLSRDLHGIVEKAGNGHWKLTDKGDESLANREIIKSAESDAVKFELFCKDLLEAIYPRYTWYHQGKNKMDERGLDLIGNQIDGESKIGVQVKMYNSYSCPTNRDWDKFLAGCFLRNVDKSIFITTGMIQSNQSREAQEAGVTTIVGLNEINRLANQYSIPNFIIHERKTRI